jgi:hypothetical protein
MAKIHGKSGNSAVAAGQLRAGAEGIFASRGESSKSSQAGKNVMQTGYLRGSVLATAPPRAPGAQIPASASAQRSR